MGYSFVNIFFFNFLKKFAEFLKITIEKDLNIFIIFIIDYDVGCQNVLNNFAFSCKKYFLRAFEKFKNVFKGFWKIFEVGTKFKQIYIKRLKLFMIFIEASDIYYYIMLNYCGVNGQTNLKNYVLGNSIAL